MSKSRYEQASYEAEKVLGLPDEAEDRGCKLSARIK